jgi:hypothetical protein
MKIMRFWVGTGLLTLTCVLVILAIAPGEHMARTGRVVGRVKYHGRPVVGGAILFFPDDSKRGDFGRGMIDENGRFAVGSDWRREGPGRTRFRICVFLDPRKYPSSPQPAQEGAAPRPDQGGTPPSYVIPASMGLDLPGPRPAGGSSSPPSQRFSNPATSGLSVELGPEPARVDIDLKD